MAKIQAIRKEEFEAKPPVNISDRAIDNLKFIRETMERSTHFTAVPGYGGIFMGVTAIAAAVIANFQPLIRDWLIVWFIEAILAFAIGLLRCGKIENNKSVIVFCSREKICDELLPPLICGVFITLGLWRFGHFEAMIPVWILLYGAAVVCGGAFSVRAVPIMGWCFIALGAIAFFLPTSFGNLMMGLSFGVLHIIFGFIIARKFGG